MRNVGQLDSIGLRSVTKVVHNWDQIVRFHIIYQLNKKKDPKRSFESKGRA